MRASLGARLVILASVMAGVAGGAPVVASAQEPQMHFDNRMTVENVCLPVTDPKGMPRLLFGKRYTDGPVAASTPAIVLVHGIASSTANWDFTPTWSVARALASAGYVVLSYDRLGYAKSSYFDQPGGGTTLTTHEHRRMLHEIVGDVKTGAYFTTTGQDCSGARAPSGLRNATVAIIGHSAGGWIVAGYPGTYHDVAAMIQTSIVGSSSSSGQMNEPSRGGGFTPNKDHPDYFDFFQTRQNCEDFNLYPPGTVRYVADVACAPPFIPSPYGEIGSIGATLAENDAAIKQIGPSTAVLLASGDHDTTAPPSNARADYDFYKANCGCDVTQLIIKDTAHLFMAHRSLASTIDYFVSWLRARGVAPPPPSGGAVSGPGGRRSPRGLTARVSPRRDRRAPFRFRISGRLLLFTGMDPAQVCGAGHVAVQTKAGHATVSNRRVRLRSDCRYRITLTLHLRSRLGSGRLRFIARFLGNDALRPARAKTRTARAGR